MEGYAYVEANDVDCINMESVKNSASSFILTESDMRVSICLRSLLFFLVFDLLTSFLCVFP